MKQNAKAMEDFRRKNILDAGKAVFIEHGYVGASVDEIVRRAGGSKRTVYKYFGNKEALFAAIVGSMTEQMIAPLGPELLSKGSLQETLEELGRTYLDVLLRPDYIVIFRIAVSEGVRFPALAAALFDNGPGAAVAQLSRFLNEQAAAGILQLDDARNAARRYYGMIRSDLHMRAALGLTLPDKTQIHHEIKQVVRVFLREHQVNGPVLEDQNQQ